MFPQKIFKNKIVIQSFKICRNLFKKNWFNKNKEIFKKVCDKLFHWLKQTKMANQ